jgi:two-component system, NarL family, response regulator YdfI
VIRVWIVAPSPLARARLEKLAASRNVFVVGTSTSLDSLGDQILGAEPDVVLLDLSGENSSDALNELIESDLAAEIPVAVLRDDSRPDSSASALRAGVRGILPAGISSAQLAAALQAAVAGLIVMHPAEIPVVSQSVGPPLRQLAADLAEPLTPREREVLQRLAGGLANKQIADQLNISEHTVKFHVASILGKLGAGTRTEAVALGIRHGLVLL